VEGMSLRGNYSEGYRSGDLSEGCGYRKSKRRCNLPSSTKVGRVLTCDWYSTQTDWNAPALPVLMSASDKSGDDVIRLGIIAKYLGEFRFSSMINTAHLHSWNTRFKN